MSEFKREIRTYVGVYIALLVLLGLTVAASFMPLGSFKPVTNLGIAALKAGLILYFFMQLRHASHLTRIFAFGAFLWLAALLGFTLSDFLTRTG